MKVRSKERQHKFGYTTIKDSSKTTIFPLTIKIMHCIKRQTTNYFFWRKVL